MAKKQKHRAVSVIEILDQCLAQDMPEHFTEYFTTLSIGEDLHGSVFPPSALSEFIRWTLRNVDRASRLADAIDTKVKEYE